MCVGDCSVGDCVLTVCQCDRTVTEKIITGQFIVKYWVFSKEFCYAYNQMLTPLLQPPRVGLRLEKGDKWWDRMEPM
ncbi:hypothetical protein M6B38_275150 [Iris pallida]|uniref:Uncharacterized protein n=1 Tax=Iris pallida TaxID=29817 RepID=A0AAX6I6M9_IRIPA|nr:hypothetical protein M6B38_275150 [Iris pallida]